MGRLREASQQWMFGFFFRKTGAVACSPLQLFQGREESAG